MKDLWPSASKASPKAFRPDQARSRTQVLSHVGARGIVVVAPVGQLSPVRRALAWANSDQVPFLLGQFNFFQRALLNGGLVR